MPSDTSGFPPSDQPSAGGTDMGVSGIVAGSTLHPATGEAVSARQWIGTVVGNHKVLSIIGIGGMGTVYEAEHVALHRRDAIKLMSTALTREPGMLERFLREARAAARVNHVNAVAVHEVGQQGGIPYIVMELVRGGTAADYLVANGSFTWPEATRVIADTARALAAAHRLGIVHRDIKPGNIMRSDDGVVKLADFGLARLDGAGDLTGPNGFVLGTPRYMSPEQCRAEAADERSDVYALGATYYTLLTGRAPYDAPDPVQLMFAHCTAPIPDPAKYSPDVPEGCTQIIRRAMAKDPGSRYRNAGEMLKDLEAVLAGSMVAGYWPKTARPAFIADSEKRVSLAALLPAKPGGESRRAFLLKAAAGLALAGGAGFGLSRWSGGGSTSGDGSADAPGRDTGRNGDRNARPAPAGPPVRIGLLHSLTGTMALSEKSVADAASLAVGQINAAGGVLGRPVEIIPADGRSDPAVFAARAKHLCESDRVAAVFGCWTSASRRTVRPVIEAAGGLLFYPVQYEGLEASPSIIYTGAAPNQQILPAVRWCIGNLGRRVHLVGSDYVFPRTAHAIIRDELARLGGEVAGENWIPLGSTDVASAVAAVAASKPSVILNTINGDTNVAFFRSLRAAGVTPDRTPTLSFSVGEEELQSIGPDTVVGDYAAWNYFQSIDRPANTAFVAAFRARYGGLRVTTDPMEAAWFGVNLWAEAVRKAGTVEVPAVRKALAGATFDAPEGIVRIDAENGHTWKTVRVGRARTEGGFEIVHSSENPVRPEPFPPSRTRDEWDRFLTGLYEGWGRRWYNPGKAG